MKEIDVGAVTQEVAFQRSQHEKLLNEVNAEIAQLERRLEGLYQKKERHFGAIAGKNEVLKALENLIQQQNVNPQDDPLADSDQ